LITTHLRSPVKNRLNLAFFIKYIGKKNNNLTAFR
jgi:hypothetical protein